MLTCSNVAAYFIVLNDIKAGDSITHLKLQKLVYFAQGVSLALRNKALFKEKIRAWEHGSVVPELYEEYKIFRNNSLPAPGEMDFDSYKGDEKRLIYKVHSVYGKYSVSYLGKQNRQHSIWRKAFSKENKIITKKAIRNHFSKIISLNFLSTSVNDEEYIIDAEDRWWMNYDSGEPVEDVTERVNKGIDLFLEDRAKYEATCHLYDPFTKDPLVHDGPLPDKDLFIEWSK